MAEQQAGPPEFSVVPGAAVHRSLEGRRAEIIDLVEDAYRRHGEGDTVNPPSYFLRFPDRPSARIIALPASIGGGKTEADRPNGPDTPAAEGVDGSGKRGAAGSGAAPKGGAVLDAVDGIKWISSFPANLERGIPRASAVLLLNDPATGYPYACLEGSIISAVRTAASAASAARRIAAQRGAVPRRVGFFGTGLIARFIQDYLAELGWDVEEYHVFDLSAEYASSFARQVLEPTGRPVRVHTGAEELIRSCDLVVFATTAATPHVTDPDWFSHHPLVLHVSLRDLSTDVILDSVNIVDDVEHVLKADTSVHLAEQRTGGRDFLHATLHDVLTGRFTAPADRPVVFSPFGLGVLDLAVGAYVHRTATARGEAVAIGGFFHELDRHHSAGAS
ncbi:2,3-diaminopropionate biosynthesis protein SbnB [Streptomyces sp. NPDC052644]